MNPNKKLYKTSDKAIWVITEEHVKTRLISYIDDSYHHNMTLRLLYPDSTIHNFKIFSHEDRRYKRVVKELSLYTDSLIIKLEYGDEMDLLESFIDYSRFDDE